MATISSVVIQGLNGRRYSLKVTPNTSVLQVLEEACTKQGVSPDDYDLKHCNKTLDLSLTLRFANLPNNAMLELQPANKIRREGNVTVGIQLESGERLMGDFSPSSSVWDVVYQCLNQRKGSLNHGDDSSSVPFCVYMRQMMSEEEMKKRTLRSLGLTHGKAMFRLLYRQSEQFQEQAHVSSPLTRAPTESAFNDSSNRTKCVEPSASVVSETSALNKQSERTHNILRAEYQELPPCRDGTSSNNKSNADTLVPENSFSSEHNIETISKPAVPGNINLSELVCVPSTESSASISKNLNLKESSSPENPMDVDSVSEDLESTSVEEAGTVTIIGERNAILFSLNDVASMPKVNLPDDFYEVTVEDVRYLLSEYNRVRMAMENKPLEFVSQKQQKQNENLQRLAQYAQTVVRIQFSDRLVLQGIFSVEETVKSVMEFVRGFLENAELDFYLYISPPKTNLIPEKTLLESRLFPAAVVYFGCEKHLSSYIQASYASQLSEPRAANKAAAEFRSKNTSSIPSDLNNIHVDENVNVEVNLPEKLDTPSTSNSESLRGTDNSDSKLPKWLKLSRK